MHLTERDGKKKTFTVGRTIYVCVEIDVSETVLNLRNMTKLGEEGKELRNFLNSLSLNDKMACSEPREGKTTVAFKKRAFYFIIRPHEHNV